MRIPSLFVHLLLKHRSRNTNSIQLFSPLENQQFPFFASHAQRKFPWYLQTIIFQNVQMTHESFRGFSLENHQVFPTKGVAFQFNPNKKILNQSHPRSASRPSLHPLGPAPRRRIMDSKSTTLSKFHLPPAWRFMGATVTAAVFKGYMWH